MNPWCNFTSKQKTIHIESTETSSGSLCTLNKLCGLFLLLYYKTKYPGLHSPDKLLELLAIILKCQSAIFRQAAQRKG